MKPTVQHKATLSVSGRNVDIHAPPFVPEDKLDGWLAETLKSEGVKLVSKSWALGGADPEPTKRQIVRAVNEQMDKDWQR